MNKVSAQQIRSLEMRIARLEREAGFIDHFYKSPYKEKLSPQDIIKGFIKVFNRACRHGSVMSIYSDPYENDFILTLRLNIGIVKIKVSIDGELIEVYKNDGAVYTRLMASFEYKDIKKGMVKVIKALEAKSIYYV
jgi:hypothetical protein